MLVLDGIAVMGATGLKHHDFKNSAYGARYCGYHKNFGGARTKFDFWENKYM